MVQQPSNLQFLQLCSAMHILCLNAKGSRIYCLAACRMCVGQLYGNGADKIQKLTHIHFDLHSRHQ